MNLQCQYRRVPFAHSFRYTLPAVNWRDLLILIVGLLLLFFDGSQYHYVWPIIKHPTLPEGISGRGVAKGGEPSPALLPESSTPQTAIPFTGMGPQQVVLPLTIRDVSYNDRCKRLGWDPTGFGLKDHTIFWFDGYYYIVSIRTPNESAFVYGRSSDLCTWEDLGVVLGKRTRGAWDEAFVWAPFVLEDNGVFYMYYTGVRHDYTQSIMLATSTNPADPDSWQRQGMIFQPNHEGMQWRANRWADCRDPSVIKIGDIYYMVYTGRNVDSPIIGWATAFSPAGPWSDWGALLALSEQDVMAESPTLVSHASTFYLLYNNTCLGEEYRIGQSPVGPWSDAISLPPGWANEIWVGHDGLDYTSFLRGYDLVIERSSWNDTYNPPRIYVGTGHHWLYAPFVVNP
jgi:hypothetical protein